MLNKIKSLFDKKPAFPENKNKKDLIEQKSMFLYSQLDFLSFPEFKAILDEISTLFISEEISLQGFKDYFNNRIKILLEKMDITPLMEEIKFREIYAHLRILLERTNFSNLEKKILNKQINIFITSDTISESIKLRILEIFISKIDFKLYNLNQLLTFNHFDLIYYIIENNLYDDSIEINYNSFLLFNKNIKDLNYATLQIKRDKLGEFLKFLFQKYEGKQSKKDIELLIINKVFSSGLLKVSKNKENSIKNFSLDSIHKKDFLIPVHLLEVFESCSSMKEVIINFFGLYNKRLEKLVINSFFKDSHINYDIFAWGLLIQPLKVNIDVISNHLENKEYPFKLYQINDISSYNIRALNKFYDNKRILKLLANIDKEDMSLLKDTINMVEIVIEYNLKVQDDQQVKKLIKKPKKIKEIHDFLSILCTQLKQRNFSLKDFQQELIPLERFVEKELNLSIKVPLMNYDLIEIGQKLSICVGGGSYANKIKDGKCLIFTVFKNEKLSYCIEILPSTYRILQAKASFNENLPRKDYEWVFSTLQELKKIIPRTSSSV